MSTEHADPGHGHSPAAWTAVTIMLVAFTIGTVAFFLDVPWLVWASAGLLVVGAHRRLGPRPCRLRRRRREGRREGALTRALRTDRERGRRRARAPCRRAPSPRSRRAALARPAALDALAALAAGRPRQGHRRDQAFEPVARRARRRSPTRPRSPRSYELGGASAISVLTEGRRFGGSLADLESGARRGRAARAPQGLHRDAVPGARGARRGRRPRAAHRGGARRRHPARALRPHRRSSA